MKNKNSVNNPIYTETVPIYFGKIITELESTDKLLDNVESQIVERGEASALIDMRFARSGQIGASYRVKLTAMPFHETEVEVLPFVPSQERPKSLFFPVAFMMIYALVSYFALRDVQARSLAIGGFLAVSALFAYLWARYMEERRSNLVEYNEKDARLLMNSIKVALHDAQEGTLYSKDEIAAAVRIANETDEETLDSDMLEERKSIRKKLDSLQ